jgi:curved DNA-binding protein CbpA
MFDKLALLILGFDENANPTQKEIEAAFRKVALLVHPDSNGSPEVFRGVTLAKKMLMEAYPVEKKKQATHRQETNGGQYNYFESTAYLDQQLRRYSEMLGVYMFNNISRRVKQLQITSKECDLFVNIKSKWETGKIKFKYTDGKENENKKMILQVIRWLSDKDRTYFFDHTATYDNRIPIKISVVLLPWYKSLGRFLNL